MIDFPNAKINLGLNIIERRDDGFHNIESILYPIGLNDVLEVVPQTNTVDFELSCSGRALNIDPKQNLIYKAYQLLSADFKLPAVKVHLHKSIPFGAGLGGGSADASFMLSLLNREFELNLTNQQLSSYAQKIGSDCAFFIANQAAFAFAKGDELKLVDLDLKGLHLVVVYPQILISTKEAYANIKYNQKGADLLESIKRPVREWKQLLKNDFESSLFKKYPEIAGIKQRLYKMGAVFASLSGSGSAVFGLFEVKPQLNNFFEDCFVWEELL